MNHDLEVEIIGTPIPQGSMDARPIYRGSGKTRQFTGRVVLVPNNKAKLETWRDLIAAAAHAAITAQLYTPADGPLQVDLTFYFARPGYHFGTGRNAARLKPDAPMFVPVKPDADKLIRAILDAFTIAEVWADDARVAVLHVHQLYVSPGQVPGCLARVRPVVPIPDLGTWGPNLIAPPSTEEAHLFD